jgi:hypothetical protein
MQGVLNILKFLHLEMSQGQLTSPVVMEFFFKHDSVQIESQDIGKDIQIKDLTINNIKKITDCITHRY